jgi:hypothetical protein
MSDIVLENGLPPAENPEPEAEAAVVPEAPVAEASPEQPWAPAREDWESLVGTVQTLAGALQPQAPEPQQPDLSGYTDPVSGEVTLEGLGRYINDAIEAGVNSRMSQVEPVLNQTIAERGEALITQKFEQLKGELGGEFNTKFARALAEGYAATGHDPDSAIRQAAREAYEFAQAERKAGVEQYKTTLSNIGQAPREGSAAGAGIPEEGLPANYNGDKYKWLADNWVARNRLA